MALRRGLGLVPRLLSSASTTAAEALCVSAGIDPGARGEQLQLDGFLRLAQA